MEVQCPDCRQPFEYTRPSCMRCSGTGKIKAVNRADFHIGAIERMEYFDKVPSYCSAVYNCCTTGPCLGSYCGPSRKVTITNRGANTVFVGTIREREPENAAMARLSTRLDCAECKGSGRQDYGRGLVCCGFCAGKGFLPFTVKPSKCPEGAEITDAELINACMKESREFGEIRNGHFIRLDSISRVFDGDFYDADGEFFSVDPKLKLELARKMMLSRKV